MVHLAFSRPSDPDQVGPPSNRLGSIQGVADRFRASADQVKALASSTRIRILRLCNDRAWTNHELARRLGLDPSTTHHHLRVLEKTGLVEALPLRRGPSGGHEKPYRSTRLSWRLIVDDVLDDEELPGDPAPLTAFRRELSEAGLDSSVELTRFHMHLDDDELAVFLERFRGLIQEWVSTDDARRDAGSPAYGVFFAAHRLRVDDYDARG